MPDFEPENLGHKSTLVGDSGENRPFRRLKRPDIAITSQHGFNPNTRRSTALTAVYRSIRNIGPLVAHPTP
jgi:hypothetical protein